MVAHTHELVDGEHVHLRGFMLGINNRDEGAVIATPDQLLHAIQSKENWSVWNKHSERCQSASHLNHVFEFDKYFEGGHKRGAVYLLIPSLTVSAIECATGKTTVENDEFLGGFKRHSNPNKNAEVGPVALHATSNMPIASPMVTDARDLDLQGQQQQSSIQIQNTAGYGTYIRAQAASRILENRSGAPRRK